MSAKTKIVVLRMKELIYTVIFIALGILFILLMIMMFLPDKDSPSSGQDTPVLSQNTEAVYIPGIYTTRLVLGSESVDIEVTVNKAAISSVQLRNVSDSITTLYPLLEPTLASISEQLYETQSVGSVQYSAENKYTSLVLLEAIQNSLKKAAVK